MIEITIEHLLMAVVAFSVLIPAVALFCLSAGLRHNTKKWTELNNTYKELNAKLILLVAELTDADLDSEYLKPFDDGDEKE